MEEDDPNVINGYPSLTQQIWYSDLLDVEIQGEHDFNTALEDIFSETLDGAGFITRTEIGASFTTTVTVPRFSIPAATGLPALMTDRTVTNSITPIFITPMVTPGATSGPSKYIWKKVYGNSQQSTYGGVNLE